MILPWRLLCEPKIADTHWFLESQLCAGSSIGALFTQNRQGDGQIGIAGDSQCKKGKSLLEVSGRE